MKTTKIKLRIIALFLLGAVLSGNLFVIGAMAVSRDDLSTANNEAANHIYALKVKYLGGGLKEKGEPLRGIGIDDAGQAYGTSAEMNKVQLKANIVAVAALMKNYKAQDDTDSLSQAQNDIFPTVSSLKHTSGQAGYSENEDVYSQLPTRKYAIDQFYVLEFLSEAYEVSDSSDMFLALQDTYKWTETFKATQNATLNNFAPYGAYWTAVQDNKKFDDQNYNEIYNNHPENLIYPLTNISLWAAASIAHFASTQKNSGDNLKLADPARKDAENAISYVDRYVWNNSLGLYYEMQNRDNTHGFTANTQIVALLACARLYALTGNYRYITKADLILNSIMKYFWDAGYGGVVEKYYPGRPQTNQNKTAYDNALFAYALFQLGIATGSEAVNVKEFILGRPQNRFTDLAMSVMTFMHNFMWVEDEKAGYVEWITATGGDASPYKSDFTTRLAVSNMLALYDLSCIVVQSRPWYEWYFNYVLYGGVALGIILMVVILMIHRSRSGTKLPKVVKGLLGGDED